MWSQQTATGPSPELRKPSQHPPALFPAIHCITTSHPCPAHNIGLFEFNNCPTRCDLFSLLHFCRQLYIFWVLTPIIRRLYNCNYSFWYWLLPTVWNKWISSNSTTRPDGSRSGLINTRSYNYSCTSFWWWVSTPETCWAANRNVINWISHIFLNSH